MANGTDNETTHNSVEAEEDGDPQRTRAALSRPPLPFGSCLRLACASLMFLISKNQNQNHELLRLYLDKCCYFEDLEYFLGPHEDEFERIHNAFRECQCPLDQESVDKAAAVGKQIKDLFSSVVQETPMMSSYETQIIAVYVFLMVLKMLVFSSSKSSHRIALVRDVHKHMEASTAQLSVLLCRFKPAEMQRFLDHGVLKEELSTLAFSTKFMLSSLRDEIEPAYRILQAFDRST
ncbi:hypothetical protein QBC40DRAFT_293983 [Triangularia verruculosa]|uniref:Uncharacterized protein n=1 Tax=Triangularia verruculosa TaxID=2587418 RepID=A0AAN7AXJ8_9PEZI|nr:hypothetical protein QBC40DRAFT_293983 [Triangularia verruculosa]